MHFVKHFGLHWISVVSVVFVEVFLDESSPQKLRGDIPGSCKHSQHSALYCILLGAYRDPMLLQTFKFWKCNAMEYFQFINSKCILGPSFPFYSLNPLLLLRNVILPRHWPVEDLLKSFWAWSMFSSQGTQPGVFALDRRSPARCLRKITSWNIITHHKNWIHEDVLPIEILSELRSYLL